MTNEIPLYSPFTKGGKEEGLRRFENEENIILVHPDITLPSHKLW